MTGKERKTINEKSQNMGDVPAKEDVKVIDMKLGELFLGVVACATLAGVGFTYYTHIKARSEERRIKAIATAISTVAGEVAKTLPHDNGQQRVEMALKNTPPVATGKRRKGMAQA